MDPLGPPPDARYTGAFARQPRNGHRTAYETLFAPARGTGQPARFGGSNVLASLLLALRGRRFAAQKPQQSRQSVGISVPTADFSAPTISSPVKAAPRVCLGGT